MTDWTDGHSYTDLRSRTLIVDGVAYSAAEVRRIVHERHQQALEITRLRANAKRADRHLKLRTAALIRLIAADRSAALGDGVADSPTGGSRGLPSEPCSGHTPHSSEPS